MALATQVISCYLAIGAVVYLLLLFASFATGVFKGSVAIDVFSAIVVIMFTCTIAWPLVIYFAFWERR